MTNRHVLHAALALPFLALGGCATELEQPDHSSGYSFMAAGPQHSAKGVGGSVLVPDACLAPPADAPPEPATTIMTVVPELGPHLPPGCANAYNLQRMVESKRDLMEGRMMGPAPAAPTARAARRYIHGEEVPVGGANRGYDDEPPTGG